MRVENPERFITLSPETERKYLYAEFIGVPASRKTTVARDLGRRLRCVVLDEIDVTKWSNFRAYYEDPETHALGFQKMIFRESLKQILGDGAQPGVIQICQTRGAFHEPTIPEHLLYARERLSGEDYEEFCRFVEEELRGVRIPKPDILYYHYMDPGYMLGKIRKRAMEEEGREPELEAPIEYWMRLWHAINNWVYINPLGLKIVRINIQDYDDSRFASREACNSALAATLHGWMDEALLGGQLNEKKTI